MTAVVPDCRESHIWKNQDHQSGGGWEIEEYLGNVVVHKHGESIRKPVDQIAVGVDIFGNK